MHNFKQAQICAEGCEEEYTDMEKAADARTLSVEIFQMCGNFQIVEDYYLLF